MATLPEGTVTLLFTDIEGSTRLLQELGEGYEQVLADQGRLVRRSVEESGGVVVDTQGDAFFVVFARARDAVVAAVEAQRALDAHDWPAPSKLRVRMGIHTGEPARVGNGLVGLAVHRAARICAAGHGGQILLSSTTRDIVQGLLPPGVALVDLGQHRLKDLDRPESIVQVVVEGVPPVLTPLKRIDVQPAEATPFAGQEERLAEAAQSAVEDVREERAASRARFGAVAKAKALDWRRFVPVGHGRLANRLAGLGLSIHATARIAPREDLQAELRGLGRALVVAARDARNADGLLRRENRSNLQRRLEEYRERGHSESHLQAADSVASEITALGALAEARQEFERQALKVEAAVRSVRARVFEARLDAAKIDELVQELRPLREELEVLGARLREAYRSGVRAVEAAPSPAGHRRG
jgi:class 3 adenylate cyclase